MQGDEVWTDDPINHLGKAAPRGLCSLAQAGRDALPVPPIGSR